MSKLKVRNKQVLVALPQKANKTVGGFVTPTTTNNVGVVVGMGKDLDPDIEGFNIGSTVYHASRHEQVEIDNQKLLLMEASNIFAVQED